jgi:hypothetical protein
MPIISARGIKHPCYLFERLSYFYEGRGDWKVLNNKRFTAPCSCKNFSSTFAFAIVGSCYGSKRKLLG